MSLSGIAGKIAGVTGAASGIGEATARRLSEEGASVVAVDWTADAVEAVAGSLPGQAVAVSADVSLEEDVERYMQAAIERFGRVDLLHLNAGIAGTFAPFDEIEVEDFDRVIAVNLRSVFLGLRAALRQLRAQGDGGAIVTTSSLAGLHGGSVLLYDCLPFTSLDTLELAGERLRAMERLVAAAEIRTAASTLCGARNCMDGLSDD